MSKSIINKLRLKEFYKVKGGITLRTHLKEFNIFITQLSSIDEIMKEKDKAIILMSSLAEKYDHITTPFMVGKDTLRTKGDYCTYIA